MTEHRAESHQDPRSSPTLEELARAKGVKPIESIEDLEAYALDVWDSDEDLDAFLAEVRASRNADVA